MSSEDQTQQLPGAAETKPSLEGVIHRLDRLGELVNQRFTAIEGHLVTTNQRLTSIEDKIEQMDTRLDRVQGDMLILRADFKEFRAHFKEPA